MNAFVNKQAKLRPQDIMICEMAKYIKDGEIVFHGVSSHMPLIAIMLAKHTHAPNCIYLNLPGGVDGKPTKIDPFSTSGGDLFTLATSIFSLQNVFDLSMRGKLDVAFLSGIQFDAEGNVNASVIGQYSRPKVRMPGGAGSAVLIPTAKKAIIWRTKHDKRTFVPKVDFVTTRGNIYKIITPLCVFAYENGKILLESVHPTSSLEEVEENTGFELMYNEVKITKPPTLKELSALRQIDPTDMRSIEL